MKKFGALLIVLVGFFGFSCTWNQNKAKIAEEVEISPDREFFYEFCDTDPSVWLEYNLILPNKEPNVIFNFDYKTRRTSKGLMESFTTVTRKDTDDPMLANLQKTTYHFLNQQLLCLEDKIYDVNNEDIFYVKKRFMLFEKEADEAGLERFWNSGNYEILIDQVIKGIQNGDATVVSPQEEDDDYNSTFNSRILAALQRSEGMVQI